MNTLGYNQAMELRTALMPIAYLLCTTGLIMSVFRHWGNFHEILMSIVAIGVIVILLNGYPTALTTIADGFKTLREQTTANAPTWTQVFQAQMPQPGWSQYIEKAEIAACQVLKSIGIIAIWFLNWVQAWAFNGLIAVSPVLIGALAVPWTQGVGISFLTTSFGVAAWHLGIALVDILLADVAGAMLATGGISGGVTAATTISLGLLPVFLGILAGIIFVALALYLAVPLVMAAVLRGGSPLTTGAKAGMEMALSALGVTGLTSARLGAAWAAQTKTANSGDNEDKGKEGARMAPRPSNTDSPAVAKSQGAAPEETDETPEERQARILDQYTSGKPGHRMTPTTRLIDQAG